MPRLAARTPPTARLDGVFRALADATRRAVVERLGRGPAQVSELAAPFDMALPSFMQHLRVLEGAGLVRTSKQGRVRTVALVPAPLDEADGWLAAQRTSWQARLDQLDGYLAGLARAAPEAVAPAATTTTTARRARRGGRPRKE